MKVKVISLPYIFQVLCFTRQIYQVSVYRTIGPLVSVILCPVAPVADKYLIGHSVCVKSLHGTNVQMSRSFESGKKHVCVETTDLNAQNVNCLHKMH